MGRKHRLIFASSLLLSCLPLSSCKHDEEVEEKRRVLLTPQDLDSKRNAAIEARRILDDQGNCIPSDEKIAGVLLPRGMAKAFELEHEWYLDAQLPASKLDKYFREHLVITKEERPSTAKVEFFKAQPTDSPDAKPVYLSIFPKPGASGFTRVNIHEQVPPPTRYLSPPEVEAELKAKGKFPE